MKCFPHFWLEKSKDFHIFGHFKVNISTFLQLNIIDKK
jgi:hypothetical protein